MIKHFLKSTLFFTFLFLLGLNQLQGMESTLQIRAGAFIPYSERFREIYGKARPNVQAEASVILDGPIEMWTNFDWVSKTVRRNNYRTKVNIPNVSLGFKYIYTIHEQLDTYIGIGTCIGRIYLHNRSSCLNENPSRLAVGGVIKTGARYYINRSFFFDLFSDYTFQGAHFPKYVNIGGIKCGLGLGTRF